MVFANAGGPRESSKPNAYAGLSRVAMPFIEPLGEETRESGVEGMSVVDVDMEVLEEAERNYKVRGDLAREDWHYVYRNSKGKL